MKSKDESGAAVLLLVARWTQALAAVFGVPRYLCLPFSEPVALRPLLQTGTTGPVTDATIIF